MLLLPQTAGGTIPLDRMAAAQHVKSQAAAISTQVIQTIARDFFAKFADYFSRFAILGLVCESICNPAIPDSLRKPRKRR